MLKNYVVRIDKLTKLGIYKHSKYLINEKASSHKNTKMIILNNNVEDFITTNILEEEQRELDKCLARKGGRPSSEFAKTLTLNFPKDFKRVIDKDKTKINDINDLVMLDIATFLKVDIEELKRKSFNVCHYQNNIHIHIVISTLLDNKKNRAIKSKAFLLMVKASFTNHTNKVLKIVPNAYQATNKRAFSLRDKVAILLKNETNEDNKIYLEKILRDIKNNKEANALKKLGKYERRKQ